MGVKAPGCQAHAWQARFQGRPQALAGNSAQADAQTGRRSCHGMAAHLSKANWSGDRLMPFLPGSCWPSCTRCVACTAVRLFSKANQVQRLCSSAAACSEHVGGAQGQTPAVLPLPTAVPPSHSTREYQRMFGP